MPIIITDEDVRQHLTMRECMEAMRVCFRDLADGQAVSLPRLRYKVPSRAADRSYVANVHAGAVPSYGVACVRAGSHITIDSALGRGRRSKENPELLNWTIIILYEIDTAEPLAFLHESQLSGMRVGATSGVAVEEIARADAGVLGLLGTGRQARAHLEAITMVRPIRRVQVFSPNPEHLAAFVARVRRPDLQIVPATDARTAIDGADIVCSNTNSILPVVLGDWLVPGQLVITVGNTDAAGPRSEADEVVFARASDIVVNHWPSVVADNQVELLDAIADGRVDRARVHELGDILAGRTTVTSRPDNIVYYKSNTGLAIQFAAAGAVLYRKVSAAGTARQIPRDWLASERYQIG
ncbi:MAG TPA: ornithine cyclodeaminase family protein [Nonomuraea sp.]|nr:ornithine cyclodeaminase family protein [Nonomuraea sp.]